MKSKKICIIGAGISGMVTAKALLDEKIEFDWFEKDDNLGGVWYYKDNADRFSIYKSCHTIACKSFMSFRDYPIPAHYRDYMPQRKFFAYLNEYADNYRLSNYVQFNTLVEKIEFITDKKWLVTTHSNNRVKTKQYEAVIVANGLFHTPKYPHYEGEFAGESIHAAYYRTPELFKNKKVLVVGMGNSGVDIACDLIASAREVTLSTERGSYVFPKYIFGQPFLEYYSPYEDYLPMFIRRFMTHLLLWMGRGSLDSYNLPKPQGKILEKNPVISSQFIEKVACGNIVLKRGIKKLGGAHVEFTDNSSEPFDAIIYATGYKTTFPFFDDQLIKFEKGKFLNYLNVVNIDHQNLYFVGIVDPLGTLPRVLELQGKWVAKLLAGEAKLPTKNVMKKRILKHDKKMRKRFKQHANPSPMINVDYFLYQKKLKKHLKHKQEIKNG